MFTLQNPAGATVTPGLQVVFSAISTRDGVTLMILKGTAVIFCTGTIPNRLLKHCQWARNMTALRVSHPSPGSKKSLLAGC